MSHRLICYTLFDITYTGVANRAKPSSNIDVETWVKKRNTQSNYDTILQAISMRAQPEAISTPEKLKIKFDEFANFGFLYQHDEEETCPCWSFEFDVQHSSVFEDGINELGALYNDCDGIPMVKIGTEWEHLSNFLDSSIEFRNIYFKKLQND